MIISKKSFNKIFYNYTLTIYKECGRNLSFKQKAILSNKIEKLRKEHTIWNSFKQKVKSLFQKKKNL